ncbi:MAG: fibronectin type III domain-containing protein [Terriglobales bacterium]
MKPHFTNLIALTALCLLLAGCAQPGAPLPPSLELPKPPTDLRASRKGNSVTLTWTEPRLTTDHETVRSLGPTQICRSSDSEMTACGAAVATVPAPALVPKKSLRKPPPNPPLALTFTDTIPASALSTDPQADLTYAIEVLNRNARGAGLSNRLHIPAIRTLPAPQDLAAQLNDDGVLLTWTSAGEPKSLEPKSLEPKSGEAQPPGNGDRVNDASSTPAAQFRYRIYRREESGGKPMVAGEIPVGAPGPAHFLDAIEWEKTYLYHVTAVSIVTRADSEAQVEGDDSPTVRVIAHDIFPPAVPVGLQAVYSGEGQKPFIDLIWAPVASADLAGYNIYRSESNDGKMKMMVKVNSELVKTPSYRDSAVTPGKAYVYSISAVDVRGNESAKSEEASETLPPNN